MKIEALCAAPPEAPTHSLSQMPLSCPVAQPGRPKLIELQASLATAPLLIVRAATKRRYRRCCPLLWRCCCHRSDVWRCARYSLVPQHSLVRGTYEKPLRRGLSNLWRISHVAVIATTKPGKRQAENPRTASPLTSPSPHRVARTPSHFQGLQGKSFYTAWVVRSADRQGTAPRIA